MTNKLYPLVDFKMLKKYNYLVRKREGFSTGIIVNSEEIGHGSKVNVYDGFSKKSVKNEIIVPTQFSNQRELMSFILKDKQGNNIYMMFDKKQMPASGDIVVCDAKGKKTICRYYNNKAKVVISSLDKNESLVFNNEDVKLYATAVGLVNSI